MNNCAECGRQVATEVVTVLVPDETANGGARLVNTEYCDGCAEVVRFEIATNASDVEFVISVPIVERNILLDRINCLVMFDQTGQDCDEAMALMSRNQVDAAELNARRADLNRPLYRPGN